MTNRRVQALDELGRALDRLGEALARDPVADDLVLDGTIQRFEFTFELFWKALQLLLQDEGVVVASPRAAFSAAYAAQWIDHEALWLDMLKDRNLTSHTYRRDKAEQIHRHIRAYYPELRRAYEGLRARSGSDASQRQD